MLRACLARLGATHASEKSYNNHWGVPLTLARMPAGTRFGVFEIGMNHAGEITPLSRLSRPHVAIVTTVGPVHLEFFPSVEAIADAKAEIFSGLMPGGTAVLNRDNPHFERLSARAKEAGASVLSFGRHPAADMRCTELELHPAGSGITVGVSGRLLRYSVGLPGEHIAANSLAVVAALRALGVDVEAAIAALARLDAPSGRGQRVTLPAPGGAILLIDESYNANPASMRAALATLALVPREDYPRRVAVLGDMLELGAGARDLHLGLKQAVDAAGVDLVFAVGPSMQALFEAIEPARRGRWAERSGDLAAPLLDAIRAGDAVMVKGSFGTRMAPLVEALALKYAGRQPAREEN
jgi:UDP-N-acetylmuramoyl-tripeptide--D-alanyl-D-alanine ligase